MYGNVLVRTKDGSKLWVPIFDHQYLTGDYVQFHKDIPGKPWTESMKQEHSEKMKELQKNGGFNNGKVWIYKEYVCQGISKYQSKMVLKNVVQEYLSIGWKLGRRNHSLCHMSKDCD